jgi:hypothetical protein
MPPRNGSNAGWSRLLYQFRAALLPDGEQPVSGFGECWGHEVDHSGCQP